jgi:hypothetical protein
MTIEETKTKLAEIAEDIGKETYHCARLDLSSRGIGNIIEHNKCGLYIENPPKNIGAWPDDCFGWFNGKTFEECFEKLDKVLNAPKPDRFPMFQLKIASGVDFDDSKTGELC